MELLEKEDLDMVDICLPTYLHTAHAVAAMEKGLHVFMEKPVCLNMTEAKLLLETQKKTGAKAVSYTHREVYKRQESDKP